MQPAAKSDRAKPIIIGIDGFVIFALSTVLILLTGGLTLLTSFGYVMWVGCRARSDMPPCRRILVLGMRLDAAGHPTPTYRERLHRAFLLWSQAPSGHIVILGGRRAQCAQSEAAAGAALLQANGVSPEHILVEDQSRHTLENLMLYRERLAAGVDCRPPLVSSRFHLARSSLMATGLGIAHVPCAAEPSRLSPLRHVPRMLFEAVLIHWYVTGWVFSRITSNKRMAARIT
jgi:uncharacterized SAM-binding protein YcdF (DUF218 family)